MRKQILIVLLLSPQLFIVHQIKSMTQPELVSAVGEAMDAAAKDPEKMSKAQRDLDRALQIFPHDTMLLEYKKQLGILKQIYDFSINTLKIAQPKSLRVSLDTLFTIWKSATLTDMRTRAYERLKTALDNVIENAIAWDKEDLEDLEVTIRRMREDPVYSTTMSFSFRRMLDKAYDAVNQGLKSFPTPEPTVIPAPVTTVAPTLHSAPLALPAEGELLPPPVEPLYPTLEPPAPAVPYVPMPKSSVHQELTPEQKAEQLASFMPMQPREGTYVAKPQYQYVPGAVMPTPSAPPATEMVPSAIPARPTVSGMPQTMEQLSARLMGLQQQVQMLRASLQAM